MEWQQGLAIFCIMIWFFVYWFVTIQVKASLYYHSLFPTDLSLPCLGKKHQSDTKSIVSLQNPKKKLYLLEDEDVNKECCATSSARVQSTLDVLVKLFIATKAEVMWALKCMSSGFSNNSCSNVNSIFKPMFPDSNAASAISMAPTKVLYVVNHGLATHFKKILKYGITKSDSYLVLFDESLTGIVMIALK